MSRKRKILDILGMILGVLLVIVNGMMVGLEYMYQVGDKIYMLGTMRDKMIPLVFGVFCFLLGVFLIYRGPGISDDIADISFLKVSVPEGNM
mgnify:CR=1 FL=1